MAGSHWSVKIISLVKSVSRDVSNDAMLSPSSFIFFNPLLFLFFIFYAKKVKIAQVNVRYVSRYKEQN